LLILAVLGAIMFGIARPPKRRPSVRWARPSWRRLPLAHLAGPARVGVPHRAHVGHGLLAVSSLGDLRVDLCLPRRQSVHQGFVLGMNLNAVTFLLMSQAIIFVLGWPLEWTEIIIIFVPIFLPMLDHFGINPILFGVLVALNLQTAFLSPPMAMSAYYLKGSVRPRCC
jgi:hypothetical protein